MTAASRPPVAAPESAPPAWCGGSVLALCGAAACVLLADAPPALPGPRRLAHPEVVLALFDTLWLVLLAWPSRAAVRERVLLVALGLPFHVVLAASAGAGTGHALAWTLAAGAWTAAAAVAGRTPGRAHGAALAAVAFASPLVGYVAAEFLGIQAWALVRASPVVAPTLLARDAAETVAAAAVPTVVGAALVVALGLLARRGTEAAE